MLDYVWLYWVILGFDGYKMVTVYAQILRGGFEPLIYGFVVLFRRFLLGFMETYLVAFLL